MRTLIALLLTVLSCLGQGGSYCTMSTWEPRNIGTKAGLVASHDPGNASTVTLNGVGVSRLEDRARSIRTGNLLLQSETFATTWTTNRIQQFGATDATNTLGSGSFANTARVTDPLGGNTADFIQEDGTAANTHNISQSTSFVAGQSCVASVFIKDGGRQWAYIGMYGVANGTLFAYYDIVNGVVGTLGVSGGSGWSNTGNSITNIGGGWFLCTLSGTIGTTVTGSVGIYPAYANNTVSYNGNGTSGLFIWGASLVASDWTQVTGPTLAQGYQVTTTAPYAPPNIIQPTAANQPLISRTDTLGNLLKYSGDITQAAWTATSATKTGAGELTFTSQNGQIIQNVATPSGVSFTYSFYARTNVPGNTALTILHLNSATGDTTPVTIDGILTQYSVTVLGRTGAGGAVSFGIRDANAAGFGSILFTNAQVRVNTWGSTYVATTTQPIFPGLAGRSVMYFDGAGLYLKSGYGSTFTAFPLVQPTEVYRACMPWTWTLNDAAFDGFTSGQSKFYQSATAPNVRMNAGSDSAEFVTVPAGTWRTTQLVFDGNNSRMSTNNGAFVVSAAGANAMNGYTLGSLGGGTALWNGLVARTLICNKTNAPAEANYLAFGLLKQCGVK